MRERISRLAKGFVEYGNCDIRLSCEMIEESVTAGRKEQGEFSVYNDESVPVKGLVYSTDFRVRAQAELFSGVHNTIPYEVDATRESAGEEITGEFQIVSSFGELTIPYSFRIKNAAEDTIGMVETPEAFAALARDSRDLALKLFDSDDFCSLPFLKNPEYRVLYDGLTSRGNKRSAMEEFLTGSGLKESIQLRVNTAQKNYDKLSLPEMDYVRIEKSTWGYVKIEVDSDADFLVPDRSVITEEDFTDNVCELSFHIDPSAVHRGNNYGAITLRTAYQSFKIPVVLQESVRRDAIKVAQDREWVSFVNLYLELLMGTREKTLLLNGLQNSITKIRQMAETGDMAELLHAEICLRQGKKDQASILIEDAGARIVAKREPDVDLLAALIYLRTLASGREEDIRDAAQKLNRLAENPATATDTVMLYLFRVDRALAENPSLKLTQIKTQYRRGCRSPFLYLEACRVFNVHPELLRVIDACELQALLFGTRKGMINSRLAARIAELAMQEKTCRKLMVQMLATLYRKFETKELLTGICALLMRGDCRGEKWFYWYEKGVEADVRLTRLYEYYLYSLPTDFHGQLPRMILLYFTYNSTLDYLTQARLYRYILENEAEDPQMAEAYGKQIEEFAREQMLEGHISADLSVIYNRIFYPELIDEKMARMLPKLLYANEITCDNPQMRHVVVCNAELRNETVIPLRGGKAYMPLYLKDPRIFTQDAFGSRYEGIPVSRVRLMENPRMESKVLALCPEHSMLRMAEEISELDAEVRDNTWAVQMRHLRDSKEIHPVFAARVTSELLHYYMTHIGEDGMNDFLLSLDASDLTTKDRVMLEELLVEQDYFLEAFGMVKRFGAGNMKASRMMRLCNRIILEKNFAKDADLLSLALMCFRKERADSVIMEYLCRYYNGSSRDMYRILINAQEVHTETYDMEERLLGQMLFAGTQEHLDDVFAAYVSKESCDETLIHAYLVVKSYRYFLEQEQLSEDIIDYMKRQLRVHNDVGYLPRVCLMALTKHDSQQKSLTEEDRTLCRLMVEELYRRNYIFAYFRDLGRFIRLPDELRDKIIVEYHGEKAGRIQIRTRIRPGSGEEEVQSMPHMYEGIFVMLATVFYGETLEYEIMDLNQGGEPVLKGRIAYHKGEDAGQRSRIGMLNRILENLEGEDSQELKSSLIDYATTDELVKELFLPV